MKKLQWSSSPARPAAAAAFRGGGAAGKLQSAAHKDLLRNIKLTFLAGLAVFLFIKSGRFSSTHRNIGALKTPSYNRPSHLLHSTHLSFSPYKEKASTVHSTYIQAAAKAAMEEKQTMVDSLAEWSHAHEKSHGLPAEKHDTHTIQAVSVANDHKLKSYASHAPRAGDPIANHMEKRKGAEEAGAHMTMVSTIGRDAQEDYSIAPPPIRREEKYAVDAEGKRGIESTAPKITEKEAEDGAVHAEEKGDIESAEPNITTKEEAIEAEKEPIFFSRRGTHRISHKEKKIMKPSQELASPLPSNSEAKGDDAMQEEEHSGADVEAIRDPHTPFRLGRKITDWDQQRQAWLDENLEFAGRNNNDSSILLVSGSRPTPCGNPYGDHYLLKFFKNKMDYCRLHKIEIFYNMAQMDDAMTDFWTKLPLLRKLMLSHPGIEWLWWMDSDAMITDMTFQLPLEKYTEYNLVIHGWADEIYVKKSWIGLNAGIFLLRNCQWSLDLIDTWALMGEKGKARDEAGKILAETLSDRTLYMADDQSSLVYLLITQEEIWASKVFLENTYCLHGYWDFLVDKYEELMESSHPGYGDDRWPFVTHFVGCKPCGKEASSYAEERCLKQMERAFNFADNQVLQNYGFEHKNLGSFKVKRIASEVRDDHKRVQNLRFSSSK